MADGDDWFMGLKPEIVDGLELIGRALRALQKGGGNSQPAAGLVANAEIFRVFIFLRVGPDVGSAQIIRGVGPAEVVQFDFGDIIFFDPLTKAF